MPNPQHSGYVRDQAAGQVAAAFNRTREAAEASAQATQDRAAVLAFKHIDDVRGFVGAPEHILGNPNAKHGEIAEHVEVGIRNARSALNQELPNATFDGVGRLDATDYRIGGLDVQSKFYNGARNTLSAINEHLDKYPDFTAQDGFYHVPKDQYDTIAKTLSGDPPSEWNEKTVRSVKRLAEEIEAQTGKPFLESVKPGTSDYAEVQQGQIHETLDRHETDLEQDNQHRKDTIAADHEASFVEGVKAAITAGAVVGAMTFTTLAYQKYREGKNIFRGDFTAEDWNEISLKTGVGALGGAAAAGAIYVMTNHAGMSAPFAAAAVSAVKGVTTLAHQYNAGEITQKQFVNLGLIVCAEAGIVAAATTVGQTLIPVPMLGAFIGSMAGRYLAKIVKEECSFDIDVLDVQMSEFLNALDAERRELIAEIDAFYDKIDGLIAAAFLPELNTQMLESSLTLARELGVKEEVLLKSTSELDSFMTM